jgi:hypothetical protein
MTAHERPRIVRRPILLYVHNMSNDQPCKWKFLARKPGSNYQQLFIKDRNIAARTLYGLTFPGEDWPGSTPEELAADYELPLEAVEGALAYCKANPPEIRADWEMEEALMEATGMNEPNRRLRPAVKILSPEEHENIVRRFRL